MLHWFQRLMPQQRRFFPLFERHAELVEQASQVLSRMLNENGNPSDNCREIQKLERKADIITREVMLGVRASFITPFDRSDIRNLISSMDDTIDQMNKSAQTIVAFDLKTFEPEMKQLGTIIVEAAQVLRKAVPLLSEINANATKLSNACVQLSRLEEQGDEAYAHGRRELFKKTRNDEAMTFIQENEVYSHLDQVIDNFDNVGNEIQGIVVEHA